MASIQSGYRKNQGGRRRYISKERSLSKREVMKCCLMDRVPGLWVSGFESYRQIGQDFSSFFAKFLAYLMIFQSGTHQRHCQNFEKYQICQKFGKKWRKVLFNKTFFGWFLVPENLISGTRSVTIYVLNFPPYFVV